VKFTIIAVGKLKKGFWKEACADYFKRLQPYVSTNVIEIADVDPHTCADEAAARGKEGVAILRAIPDRAHVVLLDIHGKELSSKGLSKHLDDLGLHGESHVVFVIGGSSGVSEEVYKRADERVSFGAITLPHNLARVVLLEQLYRAQKISHNEPYHK
jgi:23S rRNA (pseudouridine1915-N3)-methyltransferase